MNYTNDENVISRAYINYLKFRTEELSNFYWVSREVHPHLAFVQPKRPTPDSHKDAVLKSPKIQELLDKICRASHGAARKGALERQVRVILDEIGYQKNLKLIRWLGYFVTKICLKVCSGLYVNGAQVSHIKNVMGSCPVIFVPSHRSYADFILMSLVCFTMDIEIPAVAAGMDFHGMWGMGTMLRNTGAFFMRRSMNDDDLYWTTFKQYVYQLVTKGDHPFEFFIEGTRSRSNKSLSPKYGLISMILKAFFLSEVHDIIFVPINISYDRILEENLFAFELLGVPKPKESTSGFFKSLKILKERFGSIYFHFDDPISVKDYFGDRLDRSVHNLQPIHQEDITEDERSLIPSLAFDILRSQQRSAILTVFNLMAIILNEKLPQQNDISFGQLLDEVFWLKDCFLQFGAHIQSINVVKDVQEALEVHSNLLSCENSLIKMRFEELVLDKRILSKFKAHCLDKKTMTVAVPFVMLQLYINASLHYLIDAALLVKIATLKSLNKEALYSEYHFLRNFFSLEFVTFEPKLFLEFEAGLQHVLTLNLLKFDERNAEYSLGNNQKLVKLLDKTFEPFFISYLVTCLTLQNFEAEFEDKELMRKVQSVLEIAIQENVFIHPYCLNLDTLSNCLNILIKNNTVLRTKTAKVFKVDKSSLRKIREKFEIYVENKLVYENIQLPVQHKL